ncbi:hypothetical protein B0H14DRAFT_3868573 [Mycena olivaceomarginata]|nr:hypothetical protein B0H14DRAFT_3868573 [Mycena olivaceomarginata]
MVEFKPCGCANHLRHIWPGIARCTSFFFAYDDDEHDEKTYFAGGERSGISAQNPGRGRGGGSGVNLVWDLLRKAGGGRDRGSSAEHTLGGEGSASAYVPGTREEVEDELTIRRLTFWRDGFTAAHALRVNADRVDIQQRKHQPALRGRHNAADEHPGALGGWDERPPAGRPYTIGTIFPTRALDPAGDARTVKEAGPGDVVVV